MMGSRRAIGYRTCENHAAVDETPIGASSSAITLLARFQFPRLVDQHDRDAVADRIGEPGLVADKFLPRFVIAKRALGQRADEDFQELAVDRMAAAGIGTGIFSGIVHGFAS